MTASPLTEADAVRLQECLVGDGVAVIPTDTVYGLACNPRSERAVRRLYELKGRPSGKPSAVMFFALQPALHALAELGPRTQAALRALLPGPVTLLVPGSMTQLLGDLAAAPPTDRAATPPADLAATPPTDRAATPPADLAATPPADRGAQLTTGTLGLRVPLLEGSLAALASVDAPALQSSANLAGGANPRRVSEVPQALREGADLVLDGGELPGRASTVIDLSRYEEHGSWRLLRAGPVDSSALEQLLG